MKRKPLYIPMFFKFLAGCLLLAFLLIFGGTYVVHLQTRQTRGNYLGTSCQRYLEYQSSLGQALSSVADLIAHYPSLDAAMMQLDARATPPPPAAPDTARPPGATAGPEASGPASQAGKIVATTFEILQDKTGLRPDFLLLFDSHGNHVWSKILTDGEGSFDPRKLGEMEVVDRVRNGAILIDKVLVHNGRAYQIAGVPVRDLDDKTQIGGLLLGISIERYLRNYMEQSDGRPVMQHRLTLLYQGKIVASVFPEALYKEVEQVLAVPRDQRKFLADRDDTYRQWIATLATGDDKASVVTGDYDLYGPDHPQDSDSARANLEGFAGLDSGKLFQLYILRSRANREGRGPKIPWAEVIAGIALSVAVSFLLAGWITKPIKEFVRQSRQILTGETDLTQRIDIRSRDETRALAHNINRAFERLYRLASEVQSAAFHVGASSAEISAASKQMLGGLEDQTEKIEGSTAAVTELSASIQQVAQNAAEATKVAEKSNVAVTSAVSRMQQIRATVEEAADKMQELGDSSKRIGHIVEVIRQISEQTSLLALNASGHDVRRFCRSHAQFWGVVEGAFGHAGGL